eukprot:Skav202345  [mRNA]  locus=scaffold2638:121568:122518:- [translate_table: standard]
MWLKHVCLSIFLLCQVSGQINDTLPVDDTNGSLSNDTVSTTALVNDTVSTTALVNDTVSTTALANDTVSTTALVNDTVSTTALANDTVSTTDLVQTQCHIACEGLAALQATLTELKTRDAEGEDVSLLDQCMAVQRQVETVQCLLQGPGKGEMSCTPATTNLEVLKAKCVMVGHDILTPLVESSYDATRCARCEFVAAQIRHISAPEGLLQCEMFCSQDVGCRGFDFDTLRSYCRTWGSCPSRGSGPDIGCEWTVYDRPGSQMYQTIALSTTQPVNDTEPFGKAQAIAVSATVGVHASPSTFWQSVLLFAGLGTAF